MTRPIGIVGKSGQVARALIRVANDGQVPAIAHGRPELDLTKPDSISTYLNDLNPAVVVNAAAFTAVDDAEDARDLAFAINATGAAALAHACHARDIPLIHISTDYVFDGTKRTPYVEEDLRKPISVYGASKAAGEVAVGAATPRHVIIRTAWVYGQEAPNFALTMLRLGAEREELAIVSNQHGTPTLSDDIARAILDIAPKLKHATDNDKHWGLYHLTGGGATTWYGFAQEIFRHADAAGLKTPRTKAITSAEYPTKARRPAYSVLDCTKLTRTFGIRPASWEESLERAMPLIIAQHKAATAG